MSELSAESIRQAMDTVWLGQHVHFYASLGSTNDEARQLAEAGAPEGALVIADFQSAGRGRLARQWWSPPGSSLLMSLLFRPAFLAPHQAQRLTMITSLALCDAIAQVTGLSAAVKWPNDVLMQGKKVCGLLAELGVVGSRLDYVVLGMGINVNVDFAAADAPALMAAATSLKIETDREVSRLALLTALLRRIELRYRRLQAGVLPHAEWQARLITLGQEVRVTMTGHVLAGVAVGVDADGALLVRQVDGRTQRVLAGDVTLRQDRPAGEPNAGDGGIC
ncbi:MAG: biotin--[acetyl-CoA-carboxylase] ligase [Chloroflexota bacterium]